ncbi:hypothetical protein IW261DRAFT_1628259, partial [Armillaria novae-zelandiae]
NTRLQAPGEKQSRHAGEIGTIVEAVYIIGGETPLEIRTNTPTIIWLLTTSLHGHERRGWISVKNADLVRSTITALRQRSARTTFLWIGSDIPRYSPGHRVVTQQAKIGGGKDRSKVVRLGTQIVFCPQGAKIQAKTQVLPYKTLLAKMSVQERQNTSINLDITRYCQGSTQLVRLLTNPAVSRSDNHRAGCKSPILRRGSVY